MAPVSKINCNYILNLLHLLNLKSNSHIQEAFNRLLT